jgi:hypothetical protein
MLESIILLSYIKEKERGGEEEDGYYMYIDDRQTDISYR